MREILAEGGVHASGQEARWIVQAAGHLDRAHLVDDASSIGREGVAAAEALARRRVEGEPLQYLTGVAVFRRLELAVGPGVLIPRPETEVVAAHAMARLPQDGVLVDCGTGSGAIALSIADERSDARVLATERSGEAFRWAAKNRDSLGLEVELISCDLLAGLPAQLRGSVDVVVSNPPYVATRERGIVERDVIAYEPHEALFAGERGLDVIRRLVDGARKWLRPGGWLVLEMGVRQAAEVSAQFDAAGYREVGVHADLTGRPRIAEGRARQ